MFKRCQLHSELSIPIASFSPHTSNVKESLLSPFRFSTSVNSRQATALGVANIRNHKTYSPRPQEDHARQRRWPRSWRFIEVRRISSHMGSRALPSVVENSPSCCPARCLARSTASSSALPTTAVLFRLTPVLTSCINASTPSV